MDYSNFKKSIEGIFDKMNFDQNDLSGKTLEEKLESLGYSRDDVARIKQQMKNITTDITGKILSGRVRTQDQILNEIKNVELKLTDRTIKFSEVLSKAPEVLREQDDDNEQA